MRDGLEQRNITLKFNATWKEYTISPRMEYACSWNENSNRTVARMCPKKIFTINVNDNIGEIRRAYIPISYFRFNFLPFFAGSRKDREN